MWQSDQNEIRQRIAMMQKQRDTISEQSSKIQSQARYDGTTTQQRIDVMREQWDTIKKQSYKIEHYKNKLESLKEKYREERNMNKHIRDMSTAI